MSHIWISNDVVFSIVQKEESESYAFVGNLKQEFGNSRRTRITKPGSNAQLDSRKAVNGLLRNFIKLMQTVWDNQWHARYQRWACAGLSRYSCNWFELCEANNAYSTRPWLIRPLHHVARPTPRLDVSFWTAISHPSQSIWCNLQYSLHVLTQHCVLSSANNCLVKMSCLCVQLFILRGYRIRLDFVRHLHFHLFRYISWPAMHCHDAHLLVSKGSWCHATWNGDFKVGGHDYDWRKIFLMTGL